MKPIFISLSPNTEWSDVRCALGRLVRPWRWQRGMQTVHLAREFGDIVERKHVSTFNSGRAALMAILRSLTVEDGSEVLVQGFTCNALVNPIVWSGYIPRYVDVDRNTLNMDPAALRERITEHSRVVIVQHTFGIPAPMEEIRAVCDEYGLILLEDCAHTINGQYKGQQLGTFGEASFYSFGRDKVISSVYGGATATDNLELAEYIEAYRNTLATPSLCWIGKQLLHPVLTKLIIMPLYRLGEIGRLTLAAFQKIGLLSKAVHGDEKHGLQPRYLPQVLPDALAFLARVQLVKLERFTVHRKRMAPIYMETLSGRADIALPAADCDQPLMRYPVLLPEADTDTVLERARRNGARLNDGWRKAVVVPPDTDQKAMQYEAGTCPVAEEVANTLVNLPTHISVTKNEARRLADILLE